LDVVKKIGVLFESFSSRASYFAVLIIVLGAILHYSGVTLSLSSENKLIIFVVLLILTTSFSLGLFIHLCYPKLRIWPPPGKSSWQFWFVWILYTVGALGVSVIGILDWGTLELNHWSLSLIGGGLLLFAVTLGEWGVRTLNVHQTLGLKGALLTKGPYRISRNPQYVAEILIYTGIILVTGSFEALIIGIIMMLWFVMAPLSEEPWLGQQFGKQYEAYRKNVPRFIGLRSFKLKKPGG
jgi:protein-S-isoprenylcysteine O-methyltransferase Ste14